VKIGAPLVVLHFGSMDLKDYTGKLKELLERGEKGSPKFQKIVAEANAAREAKKKKSLTTPATRCANFMARRNIGA